MLDRWGRFVARHALVVLLAMLALAAAASVHGSSVFDHLDQGGFDDPGSESAAQSERQREVFGNRDTHVVAVYSHPRWGVDDPRFARQVRRTVRDYPRRTVTSVVHHWNSPDSGLVSKDRHTARVLISLRGRDDNAYLRRYERLQPHLAADRLRTHVAGIMPVYDDINTSTAEDLRRAETISLPFVAVLALLIFGSLAAASMPVLVGALAVVGALSVVRLLTLVTDVSIFSINVITLLGMGLAIDYALFVISRFREELARLPDDHPDAASIAIRTTMNTAGRTVLFSGLTVAAALLSLLVFPQDFLKSMAYGGVAAVLIAMLAALTALPAALRLLGRRVDAGRLPLRRRGTRPVRRPDGEGGWARFARGVMRRPVSIVVAVTALLLLAGSPFLGATFGSVDHRILPEDAPSHQAAVKLNKEFGQRATATLLVEDAGPRRVAAYAHRARKVRGVLEVSTTARKGDTTLLTAVWKGNTQSQKAQRIVRDLREVEPRRGEALVGGISAETVDLLDSIGARLPWMGGIVVVVMSVLLFVAFGSVVLPIKAIAMNVLSLGASFGLVTWVFADGNLEDLLGFTSQGYLDATNPILMLAILFGLSMDYEVFLLSRVREQWDHPDDPGLDPTTRNEEAVVAGVQKTGRIITSAALLLGIVIGAFGLSEVLFMKMIGLGMLTALLLDATVVRALLVPATMKLLGRWNWWAPAPMARWWERHGFREEVPAASTPVRRPAGG